MHRGILNKKSLGPFRAVRPAGRASLVHTYLSFMAQTDPFPKLRFREKARQVSSTVWLKSLTGSKVSEDFIEFNRIRNLFSVCACQ